MMSPLLSYKNRFIDLYSDLCKSYKIKIIDKIRSGYNV